MKKLLAPLFCFALLLVGCAVPAKDGVLDADGAQQLKLRQIQTRYFETDNKQKCMEAVLATLQDLGFVIDKASLDLGAVTATKLSGYQLRMTVSVIPRGDRHMTVRASAQYQMYPVENPRPYQEFFESLSKSLFLQAHLED